MGKKRSAKTRAKMTGKEHSAETRAMISKANLGKKRTAESCAKMSKAMMGKKHTAKRCASPWQEAQDVVHQELEPGIDSCAGSINHGSGIVEELWLALHLWMAANWKNSEQ